MIPLEQSAPLSARFLTYLKETGQGGADPLAPYTDLPFSFFHEMEKELSVIVRAESRSLDACLADLTRFNNLEPEMENDAWYEQVASMVSMHLDFLALGFSRRRLEALQRQADSLHLPERARFCEVGGGCGRLGALLLKAHRGWDGILLDKSPHAESYCSRTFGLLGLAGRARFLTGDLLRIPLDDKSIDMAIAAEVIEHTEDSGRAVLELVRILKPGGFLLISLPVNLDIAMHPVVFKTPEAIKSFFRNYPLQSFWEEMVRVDPEIDVIAGVFPGFEGCFHATFQKNG